MNYSQKEILSRIYKIQRVYGYISKIKIFRTVNGHNPYTIVIISNIKTEEKIASIYQPYNAFDLYAEEYEKKIPLPYYAFHIRLGNEHYYRINWDDVNLGKYDKSQIGEIARESDDYDKKPLVFRDYVLHLYHEAPLTTSQFDESGITEDVENLLDLINQYEKLHFFIPFKKETRKLLKFRNDYKSKKTRINNHMNEHSLDYDIEELLSPHYCNDPFEMKRLWEDMTEEERVMFALENGNGEYYGY